MQTIGQWLEERCKGEHVTLRQAAIKTDLSHACIANLRKGGRPSPETIKKLVRAFGGDGYQGQVLEDHLLALAGYRTERPEGEALSEERARLLDTVSGFSDAQLILVTRFADFLIKIKSEP